MNDDEAIKATEELRDEIMRATQRRLERARQGFDTSAIRSNSIPKKSRKTSIWHRAIH